MLASQDRNNIVTKPAEDEFSSETEEKTSAEEEEHHESTNASNKLTLESNLPDANQEQDNDQQ